MRRLFWAALLGLTLPLAYICAGLAGGYFLTGGPRAEGAREYRIGLVAGPLQYDLLIPLHGDIRPRFAFAAPAGVPLDTPAAEWLRVGWGAQGAHTQTGPLGDTLLPMVWRAVAGDRAILRLDTVGRVTSFDTIPLIALTKSEVHALIDAILAGFDATGALPLPGSTFTDAMFPAKGRFHAFNTSNVWLGQVLRAAGLPFGRWTPFARSVRLSLDRTGLARD
jgi:uncharacterized protein (TIGR02117 family)